MQPIGFKLVQELDKIWGVDNLVDIKVEQPEDYLLVLKRLIDGVRPLATHRIKTRAK